MIGRGRRRSDILRGPEIPDEVLRALPKTELAVMFHILVHVPDMMYRWNRSANFWCFWGER